MMMIDMRDSSRSRQSAGNTESDQKHSFPYPPSSSLGSHPDNSSAQQHNPILFDQITAEKINFTQKTPPLVTVPYTSISKFCRPSKAAYQTGKNLFLL